VIEASPRLTGNWLTHIDLENGHLMVMMIHARVVNVHQAKTGPAGWKWIRENAGKPHDEHIVQKAVEEVDEFCRVLKCEGVIVHRPEPMRWDQLGTFRTPYFEDGGQVWCDVHVSYS